jgi:plastocyanin
MLMRSLDDIRRRGLVGCLGLAIAIAACGPAETSRPPTGAVRADRVEVVEPAGRPDDWTFTPARIAVPKGTTVSFHNGGQEFHTATADALGRPFDLSLPAGSDATRLFATPGEFAYHCGVHPQMKGVVVVCDGTCP